MGIKNHQRCGCNVEGDEINRICNTHKVETEGHFKRKVIFEGDTITTIMSVRF